MEPLQRSGTPSLGDRQSRGQLAPEISVRISVRVTDLNVDSLISAIAGEMTHVAKSVGRVDEIASATFGDREATCARIT